MKNFTKIALAVALIGGVSATALTIGDASARGWNNGPEQGQQFKGPRGGFKGGKGGPRGGQILKSLDADKDGTLTKEELTQGLEKKITDNDKDGDGAITLEEFKAEWENMTQERMVRAYQRMDRDGNGKVTLEELSEPATAMFERMDRNDDGKIDESDRPERQARGKRGGPRGNFKQGGPRGQFQQGNFQQGNFQQGQFQNDGQFGPQGGPRGFQNGPRGFQNGPRGFQNGTVGPDGGQFAPQAPLPNQSVEAPHDHDGSEAPHDHVIVPFPPVAQAQ